MSSAKVQVDSSQVDEMLKALNSNDRKKAERSALLGGANVLKRATEKLYTANTKLKKNEVTYRVGGIKRVAKATLVTAKVKRNTPEAVVHILGNFKAKFFEASTKVRRTKGRKITGQHRKGNRTYSRRTGKGGNRGRMLKGHQMRLFSKAQISEERKVFDDMDNRLYNSIMRIARRYGRN